MFIKLRSSNPLTLFVLIVLLAIVPFFICDCNGGNGGGDNGNGGENGGGGPNNNEPTAAISLPIEDSIYLEGSEYIFSGTGTDIEDGSLSGNSLIWTSNIDGQLGTGNCLSEIDLSPGEHIITLTVEDSNDATDEYSLNINVITTHSWTMSRLPDTGQTVSYTDTHGEDSDYSINHPSYTDNNNGTITDNMTGLIWQKEDDGKPRHWYEAVNYCINLSLAGYTEWRLPTIKELESIIDYGTCCPMINTNYFPNTSLYYWSSTSGAGSSDEAWYADFGYWLGTNDWSKFYPSRIFYVRCVRFSD